MMDPVSLRILIAVHDTGSVTAAAELLGYTAPNITQHLRKLERALGTAMVERAGRGIVLTPDALAVVDRARPLVDGLEQLRLTASVQSEPAGRFRVSAFPTALRGLLLPALALARERYPRLRLVPVESEYEPALDALGIGRLDAVIAKTWGAATPAAPSSRPLERIDLGEDPLDAILPAGHRLARRTSIHLAELAGDRWAITPHEDPYGTWIAAHDPALLEPMNDAYEAAEFQSLIRFAELGLAVTVVPRLGRGRLPGTVAAVPLADPDAHRTIHLYVRPVVARSSTTTAITELLTAILRS